MTDQASKPDFSLQTTFIGMKVRHLRRAELGIGEIAAINEDGSVDVVFPDATFSGMDPDNFTSVEAELAHLARVRQALDELSAVFTDNFLKADTVYQSRYTELISSSDYARAKRDFVRDWMTKQIASGSVTHSQLPDEEQLAAISSVNGHVQLMARAGSGKTATLVNRAWFLLRHCRVRPDHLLILAFNRKAAYEIERRLLYLLEPHARAQVEAAINSRLAESKSRNRSVTPDDQYVKAVVVETARQLGVRLPHVMTFHALAYALVHPENKLLYDDRDSESLMLSRTFQSVIDDFLQIPSFFEKIRLVMLAHFRDAWERIEAGGHHLSKSAFLQYRRSLPHESLSGEYLKSHGEKLIADFLFEHDIAYKYERNFFWGKRNYRPDFTLFTAPGKGLIIEYFGLAGDPDYDELSEKKIEFWRGQPQWDLLSFTPSDIARDGPEQFLVSLKTALERHGIVCNRLTEDEIWHRVRERAIDRFTTATANFVGRCRKSLISPNDLRDLIDSDGAALPSERAFLDLAHEIYQAYLVRIEATGEDDFDGLLMAAADRVANGNSRFDRKDGSGDLAALTHLCIDEFQDFSELFHQLLASIQKINPSVQTFCVGDDWQAINGFAGSDLRFFQDYDRYVGAADQLHLSSNYRSARSIVEVGNRLMQGLGPPARSTSVLAGQVLLVDQAKFMPTTAEIDRHGDDLLTPIVCRLTHKALSNRKNVVLLSRRNGLPWYVDIPRKSGGSMLSAYLSHVRSFFDPELAERISISTAHRYKGLEKDTVIILDAVARSYPLIHPDWRFSRILGDSPEKLANEDRRLFYVAMTRAVTELFIVTDMKSPSMFIDEVNNSPPLEQISWQAFPPVPGRAARVFILIRNQPGRGGNPTYERRDLLKACGFRWDSARERCWIKAVSAAVCDLEQLKQELWAKEADGLAIELRDQNDRLLHRYHIDNGNWRIAEQSADGGAVHQGQALKRLD